MNRWLAFLPIILTLNASAFAPTDDQCAVNVRYASAVRDVLLVEGQTYTLSIDLVQARVSRFESSGTNLLDEKGIVPTLNGKPLSGPGRVNIYTFGTQMYEIHIRDLKIEGMTPDIELALYAYARRVFINLNVTPRGPVPAMKLAWEGGVISPMALPKRAADPEVVMRGGYSAAVIDLDASSKGVDLGAEGPQKSGIFQTVKHFTERVEGTRSRGIILCAARNPRDLVNLVQWELHPERVIFELTGGTYEGYRADKGFFEITTDYRGPRSFEEGWINPNQRYEVGLNVSLKSAPSPQPASGEILCNVRNTYGTLECSVLTDEAGFPLPVQVQVSKNFAGENEEGKEEGDIPYGESYFPLNLSTTQPFRGLVYHLFANWGTHPLKQVSSIRFFHHYFHASLGPSETFCYVPFEFPRDDDRNYLLADVRGISNFCWEGQPQFNHVSVIGALRYKSGGKWINNLLQDTRIYLTGPNLASFALDYLTEDGKIKTTLEIFEMPQDDESRCFIRMVHEVLEPVEIDENSTHNLRFLNAGAYIVGTIWPHVAYTNAEGQTTVVDIPAEDNKWVLEGVPLGKQYPFCAAYSHKNGNMAFFVNRFEGVLGGKPVDSFGLSACGGTRWTEMFLTTPGQISRLEKGDRIESHLFVMPYGHVDIDYKPAQRQRELYGDNLPTVKMIHGKDFPGFPRRIQADPRGFAEFTLKGGDNWLPILVEGFPAHKAPMLWEKRGAQWLFHDQQIYGNDWYQSYRAEDGSVGFVFVVKVRPGQNHHYLVSLAPNATSIIQNNGYVTIKGGPMDFISPVKFAGLKCETLAGTELLHCTGKAETARME